MPLNRSDVEISRARKSEPRQATTGFSADSKKSVAEAISGRTSPAVAAFMVLAAALLFSTGGAAIKIQAFSGAQVSCIRSGLAFLVLIAWGRSRIRVSPTVLAIAVAYASVLT